jgi:hypothetical protein
MLNIFSVSVVFIRTVAILIIAGALTAIPAFWAAIKQATTSELGNNQFDIPIVVGAVSHILLACLLIIYAKKIASFTTRGLDNTNTQLNEPKYDCLQAVAFSILGMYILLYAIPALIKLVLIELLPAGSNSSEGILFPAAEKARVPIEVIVEYVVQVALGLWLVLGSKGITSWLRDFWMRRISVNSTE